MECPCHLRIRWGGNVFVRLREELMEFIDSHCHLDATEFDADRDAVAARAQASGVTQLIVPAVDAAGFDTVRAVCQRYPQCRAAYGLHPMYADRHRMQDVTRLDQWLRTEPAVAVGEIGLDGSDPGADRERQREFFDAQLALAADLDLPVLLHVRQAVDAVIASLRRYGLRRGIAHAFNGSLQQAQQLMRMGFLLGFGGAMTWPGATRLRKLATELPLECIALETDAPDISPQWARGMRNQPEYLPRIAAELAGLRGVDIVEVAQATTTNVRKVLFRG